MFAVLDLSEDSRGLTLKCDPELAIELREQHPEVTGVWHLTRSYKRCPILQRKFMLF